MGRIFEYSSLSEYRRRKQWFEQYKGSKNQYHTSKSSLLPKQLHVQWRLQSVANIGTTVLQAKTRLIPYNTYLIQLALSCCAAWGYLVISGIQQIRAKSERQSVYACIGNTEYACIKNNQNNYYKQGVIGEEVYLDTCCQDESISMEDIRKILKRGSKSCEIDDLLEDDNDSFKFNYQNEQFKYKQNSLSENFINFGQNLNLNLNFCNNVNFQSFWGRQIQNLGDYQQKNGYQQQLYRQSYHNVAAVRYGSQRVFILPQLEQKQQEKQQFEFNQIENQDENSSYFKKQKQRQNRSRTKFFESKKRPATIFYGIPNKNSEITEQFLDFYFFIGDNPKKRLLKYVQNIPEINNKQKLMETIMILKTVLRLENQNEALKSIIKNPSILKMSSIILKERLKFWIVDQNFENSKFLIGKNPQCLEIPLMDVNNGINYLWKKGINNGKYIIIQNSNLNWVTFQDVEQIFENLEEIFGSRYVSQIISFQPQILQLDLNLIQKNVDYLKKLNFDESQIVQIFKKCNLEMLKRNFDKKSEKNTYQNLLSFGLNENEVKNIIIDNPGILLKNILIKEQQIKLIYLKKYFKCELKDILKNCPFLFGYSLSEKIAARFEFLKLQKIDVQIQDLNCYLVKVSNEDFAVLCNVDFNKYQKFIEGDWKKNIWPKLLSELENSN